MSNESINIEFNLEAEETIKKLEKIKQLLQDIKELDIDFKISNVLEINNDSTLLFYCKRMVLGDSLEKIEKMLSQKFNAKCVVLNGGIELDKAINYNDKYMYYVHEDGKVSTCPEIEIDLPDKK